MELGADPNGSRIIRSWGDTVPIFETELELAFMSNAVEMAGDEYPVAGAPPSKAVKLSNSRSEEQCERPTATAVDS